MTEAGATLEPGENAAPLVEMDSKKDSAPAPIPLRQTVEHNVQDPTRRQGHVITVNVKVLVCKYTSKIYIERVHNR